LPKIRPKRGPRRRFHLIVAANNNPHRILVRYFRFPEFFRSFLLVTLVLFAFDSLSAVERSTDPVAAEQLKQLNDQTIIGNRVSLGSDWSQFKDGTDKATATLAGLWGWPVSHWQDWGVRFKLPFVYLRSGEASDHAEATGVGDFEIGTGTGLRLNDTWRNWWWH
jgi:hypothetical protein